MQYNLRDILVKQSDEIADAWQERISRLVPTWDTLRLNYFVREMMTALYIFVLDQKLQVALQTVDKIIAEFFQSKEEGARIVFNAFLLTRYILLSKMTEQKDSAINSLETFSFLNDLFKPLVVAIFNRYHPARELEPIPEAFLSSCISNLKALEFSGVGFFILDQNVSVLYWSRGMERIYDVPAKQVIGQNLFELFPIWENHHQLDNAIKSVLQYGDEREISTVKIRISKQKAVLDIKMVPLRNEEGKLVGASILVHDVTEQKSRESELFRYEQYFENILNDAADAIILLNENNRVIMWNKAAELLFGYNEEEVVGKTLALIIQETKEAKDALDRMDATVRQQDFIRNQRLRMNTKDGREVMVEITRTALRNKRNDFIGSSVILRDITQQEQLRQQIVQSEKLSAVGTLAAGIAHEVGTPLTSISSLAQILQMKVENPEFKDKLDIIQQSIDRIARTVRTLVDFSRPIAEKVEDIYLNNVIEHVIRILKYDKRLKHQEIVTELASDIPLVRASFDQILQVFINICLNAADAMEGKSDGMLEVKTWHEENYVLASIRDNGTGIPRSNLDHIFEPFFTTKKNGKGTGLGLWVSYNIIKGFSGDIKVESVEGQGTTFIISLPQVQREG